MVGYFAEHTEFSDNNKDRTVLLLTNNQIALELYDWLKRHCDVHLYSDPLHLSQIQALQTDLIISYNYNYTINQQIITYMSGNIINLHISYLPWNRGASPNLWSFIDNTPQGVTIHQVSEGLDRGKILYQKRCSFDAAQETFETSYRKLHQCILELFREHWDHIVSGSYEFHEQRGSGSYHSKKDLELLQGRIKFSWGDNVADFLRRYGEICGLQGGREAGGDHECPRLHRETSGFQEGRESRCCT